MTERAAQRSVPAALPGSGVPELWQPAPDCPIAIDRGEVLRYLGYQGQDIDPELATRIECVIGDLEHEAAPRGVMASFPVERIERADGARIVLGGSAIELTGHDIQRHLDGARGAVVLACTLGMAVERRLRLWGSQRPLEGAVLDAAASAGVEAAVDAMNAVVEQRAASAGLACTWRFSPGYGDLPLTAQPAILAALNATRRCGITATPTNLLIPTKSVTAIIGLFDDPAAAAAAGRAARPTCGTCRMRSGCSFRARGTTCYAPRAQRDA